MWTRSRGRSVSWLLLVCWAHVVAAAEVTLESLDSHSSLYRPGPLRSYQHIEAVHVQNSASLQKRQEGGGAKFQEDPRSHRVRLEFEAYGEEFVFQLQPNTELLHDKAQLFVNGKPYARAAEIAYKSYTGTVYTAKDETRNRGWARFTLHPPSDSSDYQLFEGVFTVDGQLYNVKLTETYRKTQLQQDAPLTKRAETFPLIVYREADRAPLNLTTRTDAQHSSHSHGDSATTCGADDLTPNLDMIAKQALYGTSFGSPLVAEALNRQRRAPSGCPTSKKILYMGVAADCTYVSHYGSVDAAFQQILKNWNQVSRMYEDTFNVALGVIKVNIYDTCDQSGQKQWNQQCTDSYDIKKRLNDFSMWRGTENADAGLWHLMTRCSSGSVIGIAWIGRICTTSTIVTSDGVVSGTGISSIGPNEWIVVAHEIGHNFGAQHDCNSALCNECKTGSTCKCCQCGSSCDCSGQFVMNPTANSAAQVSFSSCSLGAICNGFMQKATCLLDPGAKTTISTGICGNGIKEANEECDCGPADGPTCAKDKCCDGKTCKLKTGAKCSDFNDACCSSCQPKPANTICRPSRGVCDKEEICNGQEGSCPLDDHFEDLSTCKLEDGSTGKCASGDCTSRERQCKLRSPIPVSAECPGYSNQCTITCQMEGSSCLQLGLFYVDGTECSFSGKCVQGVCEQSTISVILGWMIAHAGTSIAIGIFLVVFLTSCCWRCVRIKRDPNQHPNAFRVLRYVHPGSAFLFDAVNDTRVMTPMTPYPPLEDVPLEKEVAHSQRRPSQNPLNAKAATFLAPPVSTPPSQVSSGRRPSASSQKSDLSSSSAATSNSSSKRPRIQVPINGGESVPIDALASSPTLQESTSNVSSPTKESTRLRRKEEPAPPSTSLTAPRVNLTGPHTSL